MALNTNVNHAEVYKQIGSPKCAKCKAPLEIVGVKTDRVVRDGRVRVHVRCPACNVASCIHHKPGTVVTKNEPEVVAQDTVEAVPDTEPPVEQPEETDTMDDPDGVYHCSKCKSNHRYDSRVGKDHVEFKE